MSEAAPVDAFLAGLPEEQRSALQALREVIRRAAPEATEGLSYGVPAFKVGSPLVSFGAAKAHCAFYVMSPAVMEQFAADLAGYDTSKGAIRFQPHAPLPDDLVTRIVAARLEELAARKTRTKKKEQADA